jgi:class 3 adenylate cyclase
VLGDTVNVAAQVETLTRTHGADILVTDAVKSALDGQYLLREMPPTTVKEKSLPILTYAADGKKEA